MARFEAKKFTRAEVNRALKEIMRRNEELLKLVEKPGVHRALLNAGQAIQARAQEIITEKGHVDTGNLRRSINTQLILPGGAGSGAADETSCQRKLARVRGPADAGPLPKGTIAAEVGSFVDYAPCIEALPDGGFLFQASEEAFGLATQILAEGGIAPELVAWAKGGGGAG